MASLTTDYFCCNLHYIIRHDDCGSWAGMWKEVVITDINVLSRQLSGRNSVNEGNPQSGYAQFTNH
jgi:hypothetical protein